MPIRSGPLSNEHLRALRTAAKGVVLETGLRPFPGAQRDPMHQQASCHFLEPPPISDVESLAHGRRVQVPPGSGEGRPAT